MNFENIWNQRPWYLIKIHFFSSLFNIWGEKLIQKIISFAQWFRFCVIWNSEGKQSFCSDNAVFPWCFHWMGKKSPLSLITNVPFISDMRPGVITGFTVADFLTTKFFRLTIDSLHFYPSSVVSAFSFSKVRLLAITTATATAIDILKLTTPSFSLSCQ